MRYNGGGSVQTCIYLASMITGQFTGEIFSKEVWNSKYKSPKNTFKLKRNFVFRNFPVWIIIPLTDATKNNTIKNKYPPLLGNFCAKSLKMESEIPCPKNTRMINHKYFLLKLSFFPLVDDKYIPTRAKKNAIPFR